MNNGYEQFFSGTQLFPPGDGTEARSGMWTHKGHQQLRIDAHGIPWMCLGGVVKKYHPVSEKIREIHGKS